MSSSEAENFDLHDISGSDSGSDDYAPAPKKTVIVSIPKRCFRLCVDYMLMTRYSLQTKAVSKPPKVSKPATKAPAKPKVSKKQVLKDIDENADDSIMDVDVAAAKDDSDNDVIPSTKKVDAPPKGKKNASETYQKVRRYDLFAIGAKASPSPSPAVPA